MKDRDFYENGIMSLILIILLFLVSLLFTGCKTTKDIALQDTIIKIDSVYITKFQKDSVHVYDSIFVKQKGDTVWVEKLKKIYVGKAVHDTIYKTKIDTVRTKKTITKTEYVEKKLTWWQRTCIKFFPWLLILSGGFVVFKFRKPIFGILSRLKPS